MCASDNASWQVIVSETVGQGRRGQEPIESSEQGLQVGTGRGHGGKVQVLLGL